jgi:hypothetical protein
MKIQNMGISGFLAILFLSLGACASLNASLGPEREHVADQIQIAVEEPQLKIAVRQIMTSGFRAEDRQEFGVDLSAHFTAFYIDIHNDLKHQVTVNASEVYLQYDDHGPEQALSESESIKYYRFKDRPRPVVTLVPKPRKLEKKEIAKILNLRFRSAILPPGSHHAGVVYFRKIKGQTCNGASLKFEQIQIAGEEIPQRVQFNFRCEG